MRLREFFTAVAAKRLRAVEADPTTSNQHEFNGINRFRELLGDARKSFDTTFLYLDDENDPCVRPAQPRGTTHAETSRIDPPSTACTFHPRMSPSVSRKGTSSSWLAVPMTLC